MWSLQICGCKTQTHTHTLTHTDRIVNNTMQLVSSMVFFFASSHGASWPNNNPRNNKIRASPFGNRLTSQKQSPEKEKKDRKKTKNKQTRKNNKKNGFPLKIAAGSPVGCPASRLHAGLHQAQLRAELPEPQLEGLRQPRRVKDLKDLAVRSSFRVTETWKDEIRKSVRDFCGSQAQVFQLHMPHHPQYLWMNKATPNAS